MTASQPTLTQQSREIAGSSFGARLCRICTDLPIRTTPTLWRLSQVGSVSGQWPWTSLGSQAAIDTLILIVSIDSGPNHQTVRRQQRQRSKPVVARRNRSEFRREMDNGGSERAFGSCLVSQTRQQHHQTEYMPIGARTIIATHPRPPRPPPAQGAACQPVRSVVINRSALP